MVFAGSYFMGPVHFSIEIMHRGHSTGRISTKPFQLSSLLRENIIPPTANFYAAPHYSSKYWFIWRVQKDSALIDFKRIRKAMCVFPFKKYYENIVNAEASKLFSAVISNSRPAVCGSAVDRVATMVRLARAARSQRSLQIIYHDKRQLRKIDRPRARRT